MIMIIILRRGGKERAHPSRAGLNVGVLVLPVCLGGLILRADLAYLMRLPGVAPRSTLAMLGAARQLVKGQSSGIGSPGCDPLVSEPCDRLKLCRGDGLACG